MEIKKANLKWNGRLQTLYASKVKYIMIHHTAHPTWDIRDTHKYHRDTNKWVGIGYNFFINPDGSVFEGRGFNIGAGATGYNSNSIHVCFAGNFEKTKPTAAQLKNGKELIKYLLTLVPNNVQIIGHKDIGKTACPGKNFPLAEFKKLKGEKSMTEEEAKKIIQKKTGFDDNTMFWLSRYLYHEDMFKKWAESYEN